VSDAGRVIGDYGLDTPRLTRSLGFIIAGALCVTVVAGIVDEVPVMGGAFAVAVITSTVGLVMVRSSRVHKVRERSRLVDRLALEGNERELDVGSGRGLVLLEVARRLDVRGHAVGIDAWRGRRGVEDEETLFINAAAEGVERFDLVSADVLRLPFRDGAFDAVVSGLALHHVTGFGSRVHAVRELARTLRVGGKVVLIDRHHSRTYVDALRASNFIDVGRSRRLWRLLPPARYVGGAKARVYQRALVPVDEPELPLGEPDDATDAFEDVDDSADDVIDVTDMEPDPDEDHAPPLDVVEDTDEPKQLSLRETQPAANV